MRIRRILAVVAGVFALTVTLLALGSIGHPEALNPPHRPASAIRIDNVRLVSMAAGAPQVQTGQSVLIVDGVIKAVGPAAGLPSPKGLQIIDGGGQTLLPGLIDAHVHLWDEAEMAGYLVHGVTSIRNMSGMPFHLPLARRIAAGRILGPDLVTTGPILNSPGPNAQINHQIVVTEAEAREAVRAQHKAGYRIVKVYSNLTREAYAGTLDEARRLNMTVVGHPVEGVREDGMPQTVPFDIPFEDILDDGLATIEHTESIAWHGLRDRLDEEAMAALAVRIAASGAIVDPTLIAHDNLVRVAASKGAYLRRPGTETLNPVIQYLEKDGHAFWSGQDPARREGPRSAFYLTATRMMFDAGVPLIAGSDAGIFTNIPGASLTRELELLVKAGLTPHQALRAATATAGPAIGLADVGQIAPGFRANLILVNGDPLSNVSLVEHPTWVISRGVWLDPRRMKGLDKASRQTSILRSLRRVIETLLSQG